MCVHHADAQDPTQPQATDRQLATKPKGLAGSHFHHVPLWRVEWALLPGMQVRDGHLRWLADCTTLLEPCHACVPTVRRTHAHSCPHHTVWAAQVGLVGCAQCHPPCCVLVCRRSCMCWPHTTCTFLRCVAQCSCERQL